MRAVKDEFRSINRHGAAHAVAWNAGNGLLHGHLWRLVRPLRAQARSPGRFGAVHLRGSQLFCKERELLILNDNPFLDRRRLPMNPGERLDVAFSFSDWMACSIYRNTVRSWTSFSCYLPLLLFSAPSTTFHRPHGGGGTAARRQTQTGPSRSHPELDSDRPAPTRRRAINRAPAKSFSSASNR